MSELAADGIPVAATWPAASSRYFKNVLIRRSWATRNELRIAVVTWTQRTCHRRRRQDRLGRLTPIE